MSNKFNSWRVTFLIPRRTRIGRRHCIDILNFVQTFVRVAFGFVFRLLFKLLLFEMVKI